MSQETWAYDTEGLTQVGNEVKELVLKTLLESGAITEENYKFFIENYAVVCKKKSIWGRLMEKRFAKANDEWNWYWTIVKFIDHE